MYRPVTGFLGGTSKYCQNKNVKNVDLLSTHTRAKYSYMDSTGHLTRSTTACINNNYYCYWFCLAAKPTTTKNKKVEHCQIMFKINFNWYSKKHNIPLKNLISVSLLIWQCLLNYTNIFKNNPCVYLWMFTHFFFFYLRIPIQKHSTFTIHTLYENDWIIFFSCYIIMVCVHYFYYLGFKYLYTVHSYSNIGQCLCSKLNK